MRKSHESTGTRYVPKVNKRVIAREDGLIVELEAEGLYNTPGADTMYHWIIRPEGEEFMLRWGRHTDAAIARRRGLQELNDVLKTRRVAAPKAISF